MAACSKCGGIKPSGRGRKFCDACVIKCEAHRTYQHKCAACRRLFENANPERRARKTANNYRNRLKREYGLTDTQVDLLLTIEECEVCGSRENLVVDHNHSTSEARGVICKACNSALGHARDSASTLRKLADYLDERGSYEDRLGYFKGERL